MKALAVINNDLKMYRRVAKIELTDIHVQRIGPGPGRGLLPGKRLSLINKYQVWYTPAQRSSSRSMVEFCTGEQHKGGKSRHNYHHAVVRSSNQADGISAGRELDVSQY